MLQKNILRTARETESQNIEFKLQLKLPIKNSEVPKDCLGVGKTLVSIYL